MQVNVTALGLPALDAYWTGEIALDLRLDSLEGLLAALIDKFGPRVQDILLDRHGKLDPEILLLVNGREIYGAKTVQDYRFSDADQVKLVLMVGGG